MVDLSYDTGDTVPVKTILPTDVQDVSTVDFKMLANDGTAIIDKAANIVDRQDNIVGYQWDTGETDRTGIYRVKWEVTYKDGGVETFPKTGYDTIRFED